MCAVYMFLRVWDLAEYYILQFGMLILIDTIDVSDYFLIQNSEPVGLGLQGVHNNTSRFGQK